MKDNRGYLFVKGDVVTSAERNMIKERTEQTVRHLGPILTIVNIGVGPGATLHCLRAGAPKARIVGLDILERRLHPNANPRVELMQGDSNDPEIQARFPAPVHIVLVDGGHSYEIVKGDIEGWMPKIPKGGLAIFHDYKNIPQHLVEKFPYVLGVRKAIDEWRALPEWPRHWKQIALVDKIVVFERL